MHTSTRKRRSARLWTQRLHSETEGHTTEIGQPNRPRSGFGRAALKVGIVALALLPAAALSVVTSGNSAQASAGASILRNMETGLCLDSNFNGDVYTSPCGSPIDSNAFQLWERFEFRGSVQLTNIATGRCLSQRWDRPIATEPCSLSHPSAGWQFWGVEGGWDNIVLRNSYSDALDSDRAGGVYSYPYNGGGFQRWKLGY
ncbi:RICIN domain-containing protein [Streptomyces sp. NPDC020681]|uniref:RICIN domain-containing protein n=1 Tax=Streptomyces sp. NPDC020681 TaxID=3365083 RepID=UPI0037AEEC1D